MDTSTLRHGVNKGNPNGQACKFCGDTSENVESCFTHSGYICNKRECHEKHREEVRDRLMDWLSKGGKRQVSRRDYKRFHTECYWHRISI